MKKLLKIIKNLPSLSGVYIFKDKNNQVLYVGKAKNIKKRVLTYFSKTQEEKTKSLVEKIEDIESIITDNEYEALLLESNLIKKYYPKYNILLKDSSKQTYILFTEEKYPRLLTVRRNRTGDVKHRGKLYGPFLYSNARANFVKTLRKMFKIRTCKKMPKKVCLQYYLGNCDGPCENKISLEEYRKNIKQAQELLENEQKIEEYIEKLNVEMKEEAKKQNFEKALSLRNSINALKNLLNKQKIEKLDNKNEDFIGLMKERNSVYVQVWHMRHGIISNREKFRFEIINEDPAEEFIKGYYLENQIPSKIFINKLPKNKKFLEKYLSHLAEKRIEIIQPQKANQNKEIIELILKNILIEKMKGGADIGVIKLQNDLNLPKLPLIIECFDVSNIGDEIIVGAMVRFENGKPLKNEYRKFRIRNTFKQNDTQSIKEIVFRRYRRLKLEQRTYPDMILIDGGSNQLKAAKDALKQLDIDIPLFSFEKQNEIVYDARNLKPIKMNKNYESFLLLKNIIAHAHRFAIFYSRKLKRKKAIK